jgi:hypothetical protein
MRTHHPAENSRASRESTPIDCLSSIPFHPLHIEAEPLCIDSFIGKLLNLLLFYPCLSAQIGGRTASEHYSEAPHIILTGHLLYLPTQLQFEQRCKYLRRPQSRFEPLY